MQHIAYFLIEPKPSALREFPGRAGGDLSEFLLEPYLTTRCFADRSAWRQSEVALAVKLLHLVQLREYDRLRTDEAARALLGSARISADLFDQWWTLRRLSYKGPSENGQELLALRLDKIDPTGNELMDCWIRGQRESIRS